MGNNGNGSTAVADRTVRATPQVVSFAKQMGVDLLEVTGSGKGSYITLDDVRDYIAKRQAAEAEVTEAQATEAIADVALPKSNGNGETLMAKAIREAEEKKAKMVIEVPKSAGGSLLDGLDLSVRVKSPEELAAEREVALKRKVEVESAASFLVTVEVRLSQIADIEKDGVLPSEVATEKVNLEKQRTELLKVVSTTDKTFQTHLAFAKFIAGVRNREVSVSSAEALTKELVAKKFFRIGTSEEASQHGRERNWNRQFISYFRRQALIPVADYKTESGMVMSNRLKALSVEVQKYFQKVDPLTRGEEAKRVEFLKSQGSTDLLGIKKSKLGKYVLVIPAKNGSPESVLLLEVIEVRRTKDGNTEMVPAIKLLDGAGADNIRELVEKNRGKYMQYWMYSLYVKVISKMSREDKRDQKKVFAAQTEILNEKIMPAAEKIGLDRAFVETLCLRIFQGVRRAIVVAHAEKQTDDVDVETGSTESA